jgi:hypothetical protein
MAIPKNIELKNNYITQRALLFLSPTVGHTIRWMRCYGYSTCGPRAVWGLSISFMLLTYKPYNCVALCGEKWLPDIREHVLLMMSVCGSTCCKQLCSFVLNTTVFWDLAPRNIVELDRRFRGAYCFHYLGDKPWLHPKRLLSTKTWYKKEIIR